MISLLKCGSSRWPNTIQFSSPIFSSKCVDEVTSNYRLCTSWSFDFVKFTLPVISTSAYFFSKASTMDLWPAFAAWIKLVSPPLSCVMKKSIQFSWMYLHVHLPLDSYLIIYCKFIISFLQLQKRISKGFNSFEESSFNFIKSFQVLRFGNRKRKEFKGMDRIITIS